MLASGKKIPIVSNACLEPLSGDRLKMPVVKERVGEKTVDVLRDTGCSRIVVKSDGQEKSTKIVISWQELNNQFLSCFVHRYHLGR